MSVTLIVAHDSELGIGIDNTLPWRLKEDMAYFKAKTIGDGNNTVIMGRKTWESIPESYRPLQNRVNIVVSTKSNEELGLSEGSELFGPYIRPSIEEAINLADNTRGDIYIIGGSSIYKYVLDNKLCDKLVITQIDATYKCDAFFPEYIDEFYPVFVEETHVNNGVKFSMVEYERKSND